MSTTKKVKTVGESTEVTAKVVDEGLGNLEEASNDVTIDKKERLLIYCGPTNNYIVRYTSYINDYPIHLKKYLEEYPSLKKLFVEFDDFVDFESKVIQQGTIENILYNKAKEYFNQVVS